MLSIINLVGKYWYIAAIIAWTGIVFGYGYKVRADKCDNDMRIAVEMFQAQANEMGTRFEQERNVLSETKRRVYDKKPKSGDCLVTADKLQVFNATFANDTSKLD